MTEKQQQQAAAKFAEEWAGKGYEKGESQPFWMALLHNVYGVEHAEKYISFENQVKLSNTSFIDGYIEETHVLIEQKGLDKDLRKPIKQSDYFIPEASKYHFGILTSNVHMAWTRVVCGRLKSDYSYSNTIVYNNFPWPTPTEQQKAKIEQTAQAILDARALYPESSLADLYDEVTMPPELRKAHQANDKAVMQAYGFPIKDFTESDCVAELFKLYNDLTKS